MAGRDITIPFGPDKTGGIPLDAIPAEGEGEPVRDPLAEPTAGFQPLTNSLPDPSVAPEQAQAQREAATYVKPQPDPYDQGNSSEQQPTFVPLSSEEAQEATAPIDDLNGAGEQAHDAEYHPGGLSDEDATAQGMDEMQMSILALKDSVAQGRELKELDKGRKELAEALEADHVELADREEILANYHTIAAEQDAIIADRTQRRETSKEELSRLTAARERTQAQLNALREQHSVALRPLETELGNARAAADQAKNDERSRKSELNAAESELRRASEAEANTMAVARHERAQAAYDDARIRSDQTKEQLAQVQKAFDEEKRRAEQAEGPLARTVEDYGRHIESLKEGINSLGEEISAARNRRQYCDTVYQFPEETAKMRSEVEQAEIVARQMDAEYETLSEQHALSKKRARKAKLAIGVVIVIIIVIVVSFIVLSGR